MTEPKFTPGPWSFVEPPARGELPMAMPHGDRYSVTLTARSGKTTYVFGELYSVCCPDAATEDFYRARARATAALISAAPEMYAYLARQLRTLNPEGESAQMIRRILAKARGENAI